MILEYKLKVIAVKELMNLNLNTIGFCSDKDKKILSFLYNEKIIDDASFEKALENAVFNQAMEDYKTMINRKNSGNILYADHLGRPECLVYALNKNKFSKKQIKEIPFDHGDTVESFSKTYNKNNLLSLLKEELLEKKE